MSEKERFGLLGRKLGHSYSKTIHNRLGRYPYELYEVEPDKIEEFMNSGIKGFNVTIPYKKDIMKHLDVLDKSARLIGAVNTVVRFKDKFKGYNTDFDGMIYMLNRARITIKDKIVMILGTGGTGNTAKVVCAHLGAKQIIVVSRSGEVNYKNYKNFNNVQVIINTTPVGMYPNNYQSPIELDAFTELEGVADVIYNPSMTLLCHQAEKLGVNATNGLPMLVAQAKKAKDKFKGRKSQTDAVEKILKFINNEKQNVLLIGMPGSGKTTIGKKVARTLGKEFIDTDAEIAKRENCDIPTIFKEKGEAYFRAVESEVLKEVCKNTGKVISTGGGIVKSEKNLYPMVSNGKIFWIQRDLDKLATDGRPLSAGSDSVKKLYEERKELYASFSDFRVDNNGDVDTAVKGVLEKL